MSKDRKNYTSEEKAKIAMEALKGNMTMSELASKFKVHSTQIMKWKKRLKDGMVFIFSEKPQKKETDQEQLIDDLYKTVGQQKIELEWLKKKSELFKS